MSAAPQTLTARVSRRDLAHNRFTWLATGGMFLFMAIGMVAVSFLAPGPYELRQRVLAAVIAVVAIGLLRGHPPGIDDRGNHVILALVYASTTLGMWAFQPGGGVAIGAAIFIGPLTAVRLQNRRYILAHLMAATAAFSLLAVSGQVDQTTVICILVLTPAMWVLGGACTVVLEASEAQGEELERLVRRDPLTGLGNRRLLDEQLTEQIRRHQASGQQLSVIAMDLNGFKALNDTLGHAAGDELLRDVATALGRATRPQDILIRHGGDEFLVLMPGMPREHAQRTANAIRAGLASADTGGLVSSGMGIATYPDDALSGDVLMHVADERLIANKADGPKRGAAIEPVDPFALPTTTGATGSKPS